MLNSEGWDKRLDRQPEPCERCGRKEKVLFNLFVSGSFRNLSQRRRNELIEGSGKDIALVNAEDWEDRSAWMLCESCRAELTEGK